MAKIFGYECRRLLWNKFFLGLLAVLLFYGWQVLDRVTILGVSHTAPFSPWSFGDYLCRLLPLMWLGALFFLTFFTSGKARRAAVLRCRPGGALSIRPGPVRRRSGGDGAAGLGLPGRSGGVLRSILRLVPLGGAGPPSPGYPGPSFGVCPGKWLAVRESTALADLPVDAPSHSSDGAAPT